jgi:putative protease
VELLAPAGSFSSLRTAIKGGADAVYMGGKSFSARHYAQNFSDRELEDAVSLAHDNDVKAYVAVNTLIKDHELPEAVGFVSYLEDIGADAVILQDVGLLQAIQDLKIPKHASTQMGFHSREGVCWAKEHGISRVILARELSLTELRHIAKGSPLELEVFVHGALCYCVSGQCLFSSMVGGRSGNRGACAQPCRKRYRMGDKEGFLLSTMDLNCLDLLPALQELGIAAVKLEGRIRGEAYAGICTHSYSLALERMESKRDALLTPEERMDLETVFNRGMGTGYMQHPQTVVNSLFADNRGLPLGKISVSKRRLSIPAGMLLEGDGLALYRGSEKLGGLRVDDPDDIRLPFYIPDGTYDLYRNSSARIASWKEYGGTISSQQRGRRHQGRNVLPSKAKRRRSHGELSFYISSLSCLEAVLPYAHRIYYEWNRSLPEAQELCAASGTEVAAILPRFQPDGDVRVPDIPLMVNNLDQFQRHHDVRLYASHHLNMFNSLFPSNIHQVTLSPELNRDEIASICDCYRGRLEQLVFGRIELMVTRDPKMDDGTLVDERGFKFPVYRDRFGLSHILNSADLMLLEHLPDLDSMGVDSYGVDLRRRPAKLASLVAKSFYERDLQKRREMKSACGHITKGHFIRGV